MPKERGIYSYRNDRKGGYIEFAARQIYRAEPSEAYRQIASVGTNSVLVKKGHRTQKIKRLRFFVHIAKNISKNFYEMESEKTRDIVRKKEKNRALYSINHFHEKKF